MFSAAVYADNKQTLKIDGQVIDKTITESPSMVTT